MGLSLEWMVHNKQKRLITNSDPKSIFMLANLIRKTEYFLLALFGLGRTSGTTHTCIGQEIAQIGLVRTLMHEHDHIFSNHRNHGHFITYSGEIYGLVAEVMGSQEGICHGRGGSQHIAYQNFHSNGVQGGMIPIAVGTALANKKSDCGGISTVFIGDGTTGQGVLYESMNLAGIWQLPMLFVVENNGIAQTTPTAWTIAGDLLKRGEAFGLDCWRISDRDPEFMYQCDMIVKSLRETGKPGFVVIDTARLGPHSKSDDLRPEAEIKSIQDNDPLLFYRAQLDAGTVEMTEAQSATFLNDILALIERNHALNDKPLEIPASLFCHDAPSPSAMTRQPELTVRETINKTLAGILRSNQKTLILGEDLHDPYGGAFKVTKGLSSEFPEQVISTPISEAALCGTAIGLAKSGYWPIIEYMFADFLTLAADQLYNHAIKFPGLFQNGALPMLIRTATGGYRGYGPTHSQCPEAIFSSFPGLTVLTPSYRHNIGAFYENATMNWPYPTLLLEHKLHYSMQNHADDYIEVTSDVEEVGASHFPILIKRSPKPDLTILTWGGPLSLVEEAAKILREEEEISVELIVMGMLSPFPIQTLISCVNLHAPILIVEEGVKPFGIGAELVALLHEHGFEQRMMRLGAPPIPIYSARDQEQAILPSVTSILTAVENIFI